MAIFIASRLMSKQVLTRNLFKSSNPVYKLLIQVPIRAKCYNFQRIHEKPGEDYDAKNARLDRPLSPHLSIYKIQITSLLSILHRISGMILATYLVMFAFMAIFTQEKLGCYIDDINIRVDECELPRWIIDLGKFLILAPLVYHTCNGIRHLLWDTGMFLSMPEVTATGFIMLATAAILLGTSMYIVY